MCIGIVASLCKHLLLEKFPSVSIMDKTILARSHLWLPVCLCFAATELAALKEKSSAEELRKELEMEKKRNAELQQKISAVRSSSPAESAQQK